MSERPAFELRESVSGGAVTIEVIGEVDMATAPELGAKLESVGDETRLVVVDLREVAFLDSSGLNTLAHSQRELEGRGIGFRIVSPADHVVRRIFEITHLTESLHVVDSVDDALA